MKILVSEEDEWILVKYKWYIGKENNYVCGTVNNKNGIFKDIL
jgi:hypothetical protein